MKQHNGARYGAGRIADFLESQGRRRDWLAARVGISKSLLSLVLAGERTLSADVAARIAGTLQVPFGVLFDPPIGDGPPPDGDERAA